MTLRQLVLWRHGETDFNVEQRIQGQLDSKLTVNGLGQARRAVRALAELEPDILMASDLSRAGDTAAVLAARPRAVAGLIIGEGYRRDTVAGAGPNGFRSDSR